MRGLSGCVVILAFLYASAVPLHAYIDPGSSSVLLQIIVGGVAAIIVLTRRLWTGAIRTTGRLFGRRGRVEHDPSADHKSGQ
jgi:hypothetical protein